MDSENNTNETPKFHTIKIQRSEVFPESQQQQQPESEKADVKRLNPDRTPKTTQDSVPDVPGQEDQTGSAQKTSIPFKVRRRGIQPQTDQPIQPASAPIESAHQPTSADEADDKPTEPLATGPQSPTLIDRQEPQQPIEPKSSDKPPEEPAAPAPAETDGEHKIRPRLKKDVAAEQDTKPDASETPPEQAPPSAAATEAQPPEKRPEDQAPPVEPLPRPPDKIKLKSKVKLSQPTPAQFKKPGGGPQESSEPSKPAEAPQKTTATKGPLKQAPTPKQTPPELPKSDAKPKPEKTERKGEPAAVKEDAAPADSRPKLKGTGTKLPANLSTPPSASETQKKSKASGPQRKRQRGWAAPVGAVILFAAGNLLTIKPHLETWVTQGTVPTGQLLVFGITTLLMGLLILSGKIVPRILASLVLLLMITYCAGAIVVPILWRSLPPELTAVPELTQMLEFNDPAVLAGAAVIFVGSLFLVCGSGAVLWTLATLCLLIGATLPFLPLDSVMPTPVGAPITFTMEELSVTLPPGWVAVEKSESVQVFETVDEKILLRIERHVPTGPASLDDVAASIMDDYKEQDPTIEQFAVTSVQGNPNKKKLFLLVGDTRVETVVTQKDDVFYSVMVEGQEEELKAKEELIREVFARF